MLDPMHLQHLLESAISEEIIHRRGYESAWQRAQLQRAGFGSRQERLAPGLLIPLYNIAGEPAGYQYKPDRPRHFKDGKVRKYETPGGMRMFLDIHPAMKSAVDDPAQELWITEGVKKADSLASRGIACLALMGVWNWRGRNNYDGLKTLADWDFIALNGRRVFIAFDNDTPTKQNVALAVHRLAGILRYKKAIVQNIVLPASTEKIGVDDWLAEGHPVEELRALGTYDLPELAEETPIQRLLRIIEPLDVFRTPGHEYFAVVPVNGHQECLEIHGKEGAFKSWMIHQYMEDHEQHEPPPTETLRRAVDALLSEARFETEEAERVWVRWGWREDGRILYIDMGAPTYQAVQISADGWTVIPHALLHFRRPKGQLPLPMPTAGGDIRALRPFLNVAPDSGDEMLIWGWLLGCLMPWGPYPHLCLYGPQGSAKSTATRLLRSLIDPHEVPLRMMPKDEETLMLAAQNGALICLENLSNIPPWLSDALCTAATGGGLSRRTLYGDDEHFVMARRPAIINGITEMVTRGDLRDRCIFVTLERIEDEHRKTEQSFMRAWENARPQILGALYDAASLALRTWETFALSNPPRMADVARWVMSGISSFFVDPEEWLDHYRKSQREASSVELEASPVAEILLEYLEQHTVKEVTASNLLLDMRVWWTQVKQREIPERFPANASHLSRHIRRLTVLLQEIGWEYKDHRTEHAKLLSFTRKGRR